MKSNRQLLELIAIDELLGTKVNFTKLNASEYDVEFSSYSDIDGDVHLIVYNKNRDNAEEVKTAIDKICTVIRRGQSGKIWTEYINQFINSCDIDVITLISFAYMTSDDAGDRRCIETMSSTIYAILKGVNVIAIDKKGGEANA